MIGYAILMFTPFAWSLITSFKTLPDAVRLTFIPQPFTLDAWHYVFEKLDPSIFRLFLNSAGAGADDHALQPDPRQPRGLCVRAVAVPRPGDPLHRRPRHADGSRPAPARAGLPVAQCPRADPRLRAVPRGRPRHGGHGREHLPDAPVLPVDPTRHRGSGTDRRSGLLHDVLAGHAPARHPGALGGRHPPVPGHLERVLLAVDPAPGPGLLHRSDRPHVLPRRRRLHDELPSVDGCCCSRDAARRSSSTSSSSATSSKASRPVASRAEARAHGGAANAVAPGRAALPPAPSIRGAVRAAGRTAYYHSWRLLPANVVWIATAIVLATAALVVPAALLLLPLLALPTAGLFRITTRIARGEAVSFWDAIDAWRTDVARTLAVGSRGRRWRRSCSPST